MKRLTGLLLLMLAVLMLVGGGCRRRSSAPQKPISVAKENDFIFKPSEQEALDALKAVPKKAALKLKIGEIPRTAAGWDFPADALDLDVNVEWESAKGDLEEATQKSAKAELEAIRKGLQDKKKAAETAELHAQLAETAKMYQEFCKTNAVTSHSVDNFKKYVRREDKVTLRRMLDSGKLVVVIEVDWKLPNHVIAYASDSGGVTALTTTLNQFSWKSADLQLAVKQQELRVLWINYLNYFRSIAKDNAEQTKRSPEKFEKYLKANAAPSTAKLAGEKTMWITDPKWIDPRLIDPNPLDPAFQSLMNTANNTWIICRSMPREVEVGNPGGGEKVKVHDSITLSGRPGTLSPFEAPLFVLREAKSTKQ